MAYRWLKNTALLGILILTASLFGCSDGDDDPMDPGGGGDGDTTAPSIDWAFPETGTLMVPVMDSVMIQFNEPMDVTSDAGQITMSHGMVESADWAGDSSLTVYYSGVPQGIRFTVTLGTGLKDVAGNALKAPVVFDYGSWSDDLALFEMSPADGAVDINRSSPIILDFVAGMDPSSVSSGITLDDGTKAPLAFEATTTNESTWTLIPIEALPANTEITVTIGTGVVSHEGTTFPEPYIFSFTTNDQIDITPPTIVSIDPAHMSTMPADQTEITFTFSEPINPDTFKPLSMSGQLQWLLTQAPAEPSWNGSGDVLTVPLPSDLPAGLALEAVFANYSDLIGNVQTEETPWSVTVAGTAEAYPVFDGQRYLMVGEWADGNAGSDDPYAEGEEWVFFQVTERNTAGHWNREEWLDPGYTEMDYYDIQSVTSSAVSLVGFGEDEGDGWEEFILSSPATWAELPPVAGNTWSQTISVTLPDGTINVELDGETVAQEDLFVGEFDGIDITWHDVWHVRLVLEIGTGGTVFSHEVNEYWYAPGVGVVRDKYREDKLEPGDEGWHTYDRWLSLGFE